MRKYSFHAAILLGLCFMQACDSKYALVPIVQTLDQVEVSKSNVVLHGELVDLGEGVDTYGHCVGTSSQPVLGDIKSEFSAPTETGTFTSNFDNLEVNQIYYTRAYLESGGSIYYGGERVFNTNDGEIQIQTNAVRNPSATSAECFGTLISDGGGAIVEQGMLWGVEAGLDLSWAEREETTPGQEEIHVELDGLARSTDYYFRAYAYSEGDTAYGGEGHFKTKDGIVRFGSLTCEPNQQNSQDMELVTSIATDGGSPVTERGFCWDTSSNPTPSSSSVVVPLSAGSFSSTIGLASGQSYYIRAYAKNAFGIHYGNEKITSVSKK